MTAEGHNPRPWCWKCGRDLTDTDPDDVEFMVDGQHVNIAHRVCPPKTGRDYPYSLRRGKDRA